MCQSLINKLINSENSEDKASGLNILGSLCGLSLQAQINIPL